MASLSIFAQDQRIRAAWPAVRTVFVSERLGIWRGTVQGLSHPYEVEIVDARNREWDAFHYTYAPFPEVTVLSPSLTRRPEQPDVPIPHIYTDPDRDQPVLCLFDPRKKGWGPQQAIADTIVVWTASWLRFYEAWYATGVWTGGGAFHGPIPRPVSAAPRGDKPNRVTDTPIDLRRLLVSRVSEDVLLVGLDDTEWQRAGRVEPPPGQATRDERDAA